MNWLKKILKRKAKFIKLPTGEVAVEAFRHNGKVYFEFNDTFKMPAGRALCALAIYEELRMRCSREYLEKHIRATEYLLSGGTGKIDLNKLALINANLKERLSLAPFPDHIYKLASVTFFDETESPFSYDFAYNQKKIDDWKKDPAILDFFLQTRFKDLMPHTTSSGLDAKTYFSIAEQISKIHLNAYPANISSNN
jgi:hypothetical protein